MPWYGWLILAGSVLYAAAAIASTVRMFAWLRGKFFPNATPNDDQKCGLGIGAFLMGAAFPLTYLSFWVYAMSYRLIPREFR